MPPSSRVRIGKVKGDSGEGEQIESNGKIKGNRWGRTWTLIPGLRRCYLSFYVPRRRSARATRSTAIGCAARSLSLLTHAERRGKPSLPAPDSYRGLVLIVNLYTLV